MFFYYLGKGWVEKLKNFKISIVIFLIVIISVACSPLEWIGSGTDESEKDPNYVYAEVFVEVIDESNQLLYEFTLALDHLYAKKKTEKEFKEVVEGILPKSNELLNRLDSVLYDVDESLYEFHRKFIELTNFQHQIFLESLRMINEEEDGIDKGRLREDYVKIKTDQAMLVQELKELLSELQEIQTEQ